MSKNIKKVILYVCTFLCLLCFGTTIVGCKDTKEERYSVQVYVKVYKYWPEYESLYISPTSLKEGDSIAKECNIQVAEECSVAFEISYYILDEKNRVIDKITLPESDSGSGDLGRPIVSYLIKRENSVNWGEFCCDIFDYGQDGLRYHNNYQLRRESGLHEITIQIPVYNPEYSTFFERYGITSETHADERFVLRVNIGEETRIKPKIVLDTAKCQQQYSFDSMITNESSSWSKYYRQVKDLYVFKKSDLMRHENGGDFYYLPLISVINEETIVIGGKDLSVPSECEDLHWVCYRMTEDYKNITYDSFNGSVAMCGDGIYLFSLTYLGDDIYAPVEYLFYFIVI